MDAQTKLDAVKFLVDHAIGKAMQRTTLELSPMEQTQQILASAIVLDDGRADFHVINGEGTEYAGDERETDPVANQYE